MNHYNKQFWIDLHTKITLLNNNSHPLDLNACKFICNLINTNKFKTMLEIGTGYGFSSLFFAINSNIELIDTYEKNIEPYQFAKSLDNTKKINYYHSDIFNELINKKYDFIFIDASKKHQYKLVDYISDFLNQKGIIVIDNIYLNRLKENNNKQVNKILEDHKKFINYLDNHLIYNVDYINIDDGIAILKRK